MQRKYKIGYIIGPSGPKFQGTYYDKFRVTSKRPWLIDNQYYSVPSDFYINDNGKKLRTINTTEKYVRIDNALGLYIKYYLPQFDIDLIPASKISNKLLSKYDLIINQFMDLLIVGANSKGNLVLIRKFSKNGNQHSILKNIYQKHVNKIYPPINYQNMIYDKCKYYNFLQKNKFPVAKWLCISKKQYSNKSSNVLKRIKSETGNWGELFAKPVHGVDGNDVRKLFESTAPKFKKQLYEYSNVIFENPRYPKIVIQKYHKNFERNVPQFRMYFLDEKLSHSILGLYTKDGYETFVPKQEKTNHNKKNTYDFPDYDKLKRLAKKILKKIKQKYFKTIPMFISRIDFGCCLDSTENKYFVNELEFNPGLYLHQDGSRKYNFDINSGNLLVQIIKKKFKLLN